METTTQAMQTLGDWVEIAPWKSGHVALIALGPEGFLESAHSVGGKRLLLADPTLTLVAVWSGQRRTTARLMTQAERQEVRDRLG